MQLEEIRDLDGPNFFILQPAIKIEVVLSEGDAINSQRRDAAAQVIGRQIPADPMEALQEVVGGLHQRAALPQPTFTRRNLDIPKHVALAFTWEWRTAAIAIAENAVRLLTEDDVSDPTAQILDCLAHDRAENDHPLWVRDSERRVPSIAITGTNGKTTTTRLVAHICRTAGKHTGWSSSSGVYIDGEQVIEGDYTGPSGARRVLEDPLIDIAVLETARGGMLLRGVAFESADVGVMINVTADHLSLQGIETVDTLAEVKSIIVRLVCPDGLAVLNADDPRVAAQKQRLHCNVLFVTQEPDSPIVAQHIADGGRAIARVDDSLVLLTPDGSTPIIDLVDAPITWGGVAHHMVENAMCAAGAALGIGLTLDEIAAGLGTFRSDIRSNAGRLNVFRLHGRIIVVDYAHNESGLDALISFARGLMGDTGSLSVVIGTAGDRQDDVLHGIGRIAAARADRIYIKENLRYLRGRPAEDIVTLIRAGVVEHAGEPKLQGVFPSEHAALVGALDRTEPGDAIAVMCVQDQLAIYRELRDRGAEEWR